MDSLFQMEVCHSNMTSSSEIPFLSDLLSTSAMANALLVGTPVNSHYLMQPSNIWCKLIIHNKVSSYMKDYSTYSKSYHRRLHKPMKDVFVGAHTNTYEHQIINMDGDVRASSCSNNRKNVFL